MNKKGFTLIELLAVIVILALVLIITIPSLTGVYKNAKLKSEKAFVERLSQAIDSYITLNSELIDSWSYVGEKTKVGEKTPVDVYSATINVDNLINNELFTEEDFINPSTKKKCNSEDFKITIYKDSDYVYCYRVIAEDNKCLSNDYLSSNEIIRIRGDRDTENYIIETCNWGSNRVIRN